MEHDNIDLDTKPNNRQNAGRYGNKTNKTVKFSQAAASNRRKNPEIISEIIEDDTMEEWQRVFRGAERSVGVSLNANKNWEWVDKQVAHQEGRDNLKRSQDGTPYLYKNCGY